MARASTPTLLSLDRFARIMGIAPPHFAGAIGSTVFPAVGSCSKVWPQHTWQNEADVLSREEVAQAIYDAERDIRTVLGFGVAPAWESEELHDWPAYTNGYVNAYSQQVKTLWGKVIAPGVRATSVIEEEAAIVYSDPDNDGYDELATVSVSTSLTNAREAKLYFAGTSAAPEWEIRPVRSKSITSGTLTFEADAWLFLDPDLWERYPPKGGVPNIPLEDAASYVESVDVYREYNDTTGASSVFFWHGSGSGWCGVCNGIGCAVCGLTSQNGCFAIIDGQHGVVQPYPATYSEDDVAWAYATPSVCGVPSMVRLNYYAGMYGQRYLKGQDTDPLDHYLAQAITWLAVARLDRPLCDCGNANTVAKELQRDASAFTKGNDRFARFKEMDIFSNPLGTRVGEVRAYQRVSHLMGEVVMRGVAL